MKSTEQHPPHFFLRLFRWFCRPDFREEIEGDLLEQYHTHAQEFGRKKANLLFIKEVLHLFKPALIGNFNQLTHINAFVMILKSKTIFILLAIVAGILCIPLIAMQFNNGVHWDGFDFLVMGTLLLITGFAIDFVRRKITSTRTRVILVCAVVCTFLLIWAELAVGIFGTPFAGQ